MNDYKWLHKVFDDLEPFARDEDLEPLIKELLAARVTFRHGIGAPQSSASEVTDICERVFLSYHGAPH
ncbi:hypothetical protein Q4577_22635 [Marinovum sp. 2_MG-2023]|uniref:hypothetical protein n=1 Tax=unclassified Marinovum TaxID=2647166 RepID=UPI0026E326A8|nr:MULTISPECIES: hypothetical protein [unclassified Marinovum]MDO6732818.1 hypothetical protein [Marinovum sp. 2_MG-2023]MDO6782279.1 hypothetical protein [Marinovum sp. 1_MG-2023]